MRTIALSILTIILVSACSARSVLVHKKVDYDPKTEARVRIYNLNGNGTTKIFEETSCQDIKDDPSKGPSKNPFKRENRHNGLPKRTLKNISVGMPLTEESAKALERKNYFETTSFEEKVVTANKPMVTKGSFFFSSTTSTVTCDIMSEFILKAGKDYEIRFGTLELAGKKYCKIYVNELEPYSIATNSKVGAKVGKEIQTLKCN